MIRRLVPALMLAAMPAASALAQAPPAETGVNRFQFYKVEDGFLRLDLRTGQVSLCGRRTMVWSCPVVPEERIALETEIARLQGENASLKKALLDKGLPLPATVRSPPARDEGELRGRGPTDLDRMVAAAERVWRRLVEIMSRLHAELLKKG